MQHFTEILLFTSLNLKNVQEKIRVKTMKIQQQIYVFLKINEKFVYLVEYIQYAPIFYLYHILP